LGERKQEHGRGEEEGENHAKPGRKVVTEMGGGRGEEKVSFRGFEHNVSLNIEVPKGCELVTEIH